MVGIARPADDDLPGPKIDWPEVKGLEKQKANQPDISPLPSDKPTPITVRNTSALNNPLHLEVFGEPYQISPNSERAFRFADRTETYARLS